jgi:hypothetical protein
MLQVFERGGQRMILDTNFVDGDTYALRVVDANGVESVEYCRTLREVVERQVALHVQLARDGWTRMGTRIA